MNYPEGITVLAIRNAEDDKLYVYGEGVYVGMQPRPGTEEIIPVKDYMIIEQMISEDDAIPLEEHWELKLVEDAREHGAIAVGVSREQVIASIQRQRERPMDERVEELYRRTNENPCIYLDNGQIIWGYQCWWGPLGACAVKFPESVFERVDVPVPEDNERWRDA